MPKFRFTTQDGNKIDRDDVPLEFPDEKRQPTMRRGHWSIWRMTSCQTASART